MTCSRSQEIDLAVLLADPEAPGRSEFFAHYPGCTDCAREVAAWSRLESWLSASSEVDGHPTEAELVAHANEPASLAASARAAIEVHLEGCGACRSEIAVLRDFDFAALSAPASAPSPGRAPASPSWLERIREALVELLSPVPAPAWAAVALALLLVPAALVLWRDDPSGSAVPEVQQARTVPAEETRVAEQPATGAVPSTPEPELAPEPVVAEVTSPVPEGVGSPEPVVVAEAPPTSVAPDRPTPEPATSVPPPVATEDPAEPDLEPFQIAALLPATPPGYVADPALLGGSLSTMRINDSLRARRAALPQVRALAPEHVAVTFERSPVLYWFLSGSSEVPVEITLSDPQGVEPLVEIRLEPPVSAGLHAFALSEHSVRLPPDTTIQWFVSLVPDADRRDADIVSGGAVRLAPLTPAVASRLDASPQAERAHVLAASGYWIDAFATLSVWLDAEPDAQNLRAYRQALLEQVALDDVARALDTP